MPITSADVRRWLDAVTTVITEHSEELTQLDAAIGDADHGANMARGFQAVQAKLASLAPDADIGTILRTVAMTLIGTVGGAAGPLYGTFFLQLAQKTAGKQELSAQEWAEAFAAAVQGVMARGQAQPGDKTMVDALVPARDALQAALAEGVPFSQALAKAAEAAEAGMRATVPLVARRGRASYLGERSAGHQDPGATSSALILRAAATTWADAA